MVRRITDLLGYLDERLGKHSGRGPEYQFDCPACIDRTGSESAGRKLGINLGKRVGGCFRCEFSFRGFRALFRYLNGGYVRMEEIALLLDEPVIPKGSVGDAVRDIFRNAPEEASPALKPHRLPHGCTLLARVPLDHREHPRTRLAFEYLFSRGVDEDTIDRFQIGYCAVGRYARRLIFPVIQGGEQVYFTTRYCGDHPMKSLNEPNVEGFHQRSTCLLNYDACVGVEAIAVVEGPFDMLAYQHAVALMGKHTAAGHIRLIAHLVAAGLQEVVISLDSSAGRATDALYAALLPVVPHVSVLALAQGDPWSRRQELPVLLEGRTAPSVGSRLRQRLSRP